MEESKIKRNHFWLILLYIFILLAPVLCIKGIIDYNNNKEKEEAIAFLKENISELEPICKKVYEEKNNECTRWQYYTVCYQDDSVLIDETGLTSLGWVLWYLNDNWYYQKKPIDDNDRIIITNSVK